MRRRIFGAMCSVALVTALFISCLVTFFMYKQFYGNMEYDVRNSAQYIALAVNQNGEQYLSEVKKTKATNRITIIQPDGKVIYDNKEKPEVMANHKNRNEFQDALKTGLGEETRFSETLRETTFYSAVLLDNGNVLRVANTTNSVYSMVLNFLPFILLITITVMIGAIVLANLVTKRIVDPINKINLKQPLENEVYDELSPLLSKLHKQNEQIKLQISQLRQKQEEFETITENMREGLILLDKNENIISLNKSIQDIFNLSGDYIGKKFINITRNDEILKAVKVSSFGDSGEVLFDKDERFYKLFSSPVKNGVRVSGIVIIVLDITESHLAEKTRREFSANVSHELKTPLTSISGYAELLKNGMVRPEDIQMFSKRIYNEAQNLIVMIENIISLSRLDEGNFNNSFETVDLNSLAKDVIVRLKPTADIKNIEIVLNGEKAEIKGIRQLLYELIYNLCENGIKYNNKDGKLFVDISNKADNVILNVRDTGIGIPENEQSRIFERFYRVDKSHTRSSGLEGGTGLGLSIVKHCVKLHYGKIDVISQHGKGSEFIVTFKKNI